VRRVDATTQRCRVGKRGENNARRARAFTPTLAHLHGADDGVVVGNFAPAVAKVDEERLNVFRRESDARRGKRSAEALLGERNARGGARCGVGEVAAQRGEGPHAVAPDAAPNSIDERHGVARVPSGGSDERRSARVRPHAATARDLIQTRIRSRIRTLRKDRRLVSGENASAEARLPPAGGLEPRRRGRVDESGATTRRAAPRHLARDAKGAPSGARRHRPRSNRLSHMVPVEIHDPGGAVRE
jgi:hypothetical protein